MLFDCINYNTAKNKKEQLANQKEKAIKKAISASCRDCKKNPLMAGAECTNQKSCLIVHDALVKQGLG